MPANALQVESREFSSFTAQQANMGIDITGEYTITISNNGVLPVPVSVTVSAVDIAGTTIIEDETKNVGRVGGGQEAEASFEFELTTQGNNLSNFASQACGGRTTEAEVEETIGGILLAITTEDSVEIESPSPSCNLGGGTTPEPEPEPQPDPDPDPDPPEGDPDPQPPEVQQVDVEGATDPLEDLDYTYEVDDQPDGIETYTWENSKTGEVQNTSDDEYTTTFNSSGDFTITVTGRNSNNQPVAEGSISGEVLAQTGGGGDEDEDTGGGGGTCTNDPPDGNLGSTDPSDGEISSVEITSVDVSGDTATVNYEAEGFIFSGTVDLRVFVKVPDTGFGGGSIVESGEVHSQGRNTASYSQDLDIGCIDDDFSVTLEWDDSAGNSGTESEGGLSPSGTSESGIPSMDQAAALKDRRFD